MDKMSITQHINNNFNEKHIERKMMLITFKNYFVSNRVTDIKII